MIFFKTVSSGNDFIHVKDTGRRFPNDEQKGGFTRTICDRKNGAGADGVVFYRMRKPEVLFQIFNQNGEEAELSGNGMAGLSAVLINLGFFKDRVVLNTRVGKREVRLHKKEGKTFVLNVEIGKPFFASQSFFPFLNENQIQYEFKGITFFPVSMGNPHAVVLVDEGLTPPQLNDLGRSISTAPIFPKGTNVELVFQKNDEYPVYFYERGVGETGSSSTGAAAVFSVLRSLGKIRDRMKIKTPGHTIVVSGKETVWVENLCEIVYKGVYDS